MAGNQINQRAGNEKRVDFARAAFLHGHACGFYAGQAADAGADVHTHAVFIEAFHIIQPGIGHGLQRGGDAVVDKHIHAAGFFGADVGADVEIFYFACDLAGQLRGVETGDGADAALAGQQVAPCAVDIVADGRHLAQAGDNHSSLTHNCLALRAQTALLYRPSERPHVYSDGEKCRR